MQNDLDTAWSAYTTHRFPDSGALYDWYKLSLGKTADQSPDAVRSHMLLRTRYRELSGDVTETTARIYINVRAGREEAVFEWIKSHLRVNGSLGVVGYKVARGDGAAMVRDSIVIYARTAPPCAEIIAKIKEYPHQAGDFFDEPVHLTAPSGIPGVSLASEPPSASTLRASLERKKGSGWLASHEFVIPERWSASTYRCDLLFAAMKRSTTQEDYRRQVVEFLWRGGIDLTDLAVQHPPSETVGELLVRDKTEIVRPVKSQRGDIAAGQWLPDAYDENGKLGPWMAIRRIGGPVKREGWADLYTYEARRWK